jgi:acetyltransferase-like isoleucine patch superfamily enzyme
MSVGKIFRVARVIFRAVPGWITFPIMHLFLKSKYDLRIGKGSRVRADSIFEGHNSVFNGTEVFGSQIGRFTYIANNSQIRKAKIGRFCCIGDNVRTLLGRHPTSKYVSIHNAFYSPEPVVGKTFSKVTHFEEHLYIDPDEKYVVEIGNDVWIGNDVRIMDSIKIGHGAVIAAGSIVTKNVAPYAIVGGVPAKVIKWRFEQSDIDFLLKLQWWNWDTAKIEKNSALFLDIAQLKNQFENQLDQK